MPHRTRLVSGVLASGLLLLGCSPAVSARIARSDLPRNEHPQLAAATVSGLASTNNAFAFDLYRSLNSKPGNLVFSPFSISLALSMPYAGASGQTASQMARVLHFDLTQATLPVAFNGLDLALTREGQPSSGGGQPLQLDIANSAWADQTLSFLPKYLDILARNYATGLQLVDFIHQSEAARRQINTWVAQQTQQKIQNLIPPGSLDSSARLVLVNAIYFKADWLSPFGPSDTSPGSFTRPDGSRVQTPMMSNPSVTAPYVAGAGYRAVELPYQGGTAVMDLILPDAGSFTDFEGRLDAELLNQIVSSMQPTSLSLKMPKFKFGASLDLGSQLSQLGMTDALDPNRADFSGITGSPDLFISKILHQAVVTVDEKGTEAAAATSVIMAPTSILQEGVSLPLDHPFVFVIRDVSTGQILFLGRVVDPTQP